MKVYGYVRMTADSQDVEQQKTEIFHYAALNNLNIDEIIEEAVSVRKSYKDRTLGTLIENLKPRDVFIVCGFSNFSKKFLEIVEILAKIVEKQTYLHIATVKLELWDEQHFQLLADALQLVRQVAKSMISTNTKEGLARLKAEGKTLGRPKGTWKKNKLDGKEAEIKNFLSKNIAKSYIARMMGVSPQTMYCFIKTRGLD